MPERAIDRPVRCRTPILPSTVELAKKIKCVNWDLENWALQPLSVPETPPAAEPQ